MLRTAASPLIAVVLVVAGLLAPPFAGVGFACSCVRPTPSSSGVSPLAQMVDQASAVFLGEVRAVDRVQEELPISGQAGPIRVVRVNVRFDVLETWKGPSDPTVTVWTGASEGECGIDFQPGASYLVFATTGQDGRLGTGLCSNTKPLAEAAADQAELGPGTRPAQTSAPRQLPDAPPFQPWMAAVVAVVLVPVSLGALWLVFGGRRRPPA